MTCEYYKLNTEVNPEGVCKYKGKCIIKLGTQCSTEGEGDGPLEKLTDKQIELIKEYKILIY